MLVTRRANSSNEAKSAWLKVLLSGMFWYVYLAFLLTISFLPQRFDSQVWHWFSLVFYSYLACYLFVVLIGLDFNRKGIYRARWFVACFSLTLIWLLMQTLLPSESMSSLILAASSSVPDWFNPNAVISITPAKTKWLLMSNILVLAWFLLSVALIDSRPRLHQVLLLLMAVGLLHAMVGIFALYSEVLLVAREELDGHYSAARAWFVNRNHYAAFLSLTVAAGASYLLKVWLGNMTKNTQDWLPARFAWQQWIAVFTLSVTFVAIALSQSRGGFLGLLLSVLLLFFWQSQLRSLALLHWRSIVAICLALLSLLGYFGQELVNRLSTGALTLGERAAQWQITLDAILQAPLSGYGAGSYGTVFQVFREYSDLRWVIFNQSHNEYLHIWLEQGLIGLLLWLGLLAIVFHSALRSLSKTVSGFIAGVLISSVLVLIAALVQAMVDFNLQIMNIRIYFFAIMALIFAVPSINRGKRKQRPSVGATHSSKTL